MELRHIRSFIAVAEERQFRRAAERLGMAQPPLSMQIKALERELGTLLLRRSRRSVELTEAGELFLPECRRIVADVERAVAIAERAERGEQGHIEIGFTGSSSFNPFVPRALRTFRARFPYIELSLAEHNTLDLVEAVRANKLDAAFVRPPIESSPNLTIEIMVEEDLLIALPAAHPLARHASLDISALSDQTFLMRPRQVGSGMTDGIIAAFHAAGLNPVFSRHAAPQMSSLLIWWRLDLAFRSFPRRCGKYYRRKWPTDRSGAQSCRARPSPSPRGQTISPQSSAISFNSSAS